jgi:Flagellar transcriptional activator (FlhC)
LGYLYQIYQNAERPASEVAMRISDSRYSRDRLRLDVAMRFISHEARTRTIRQWTGLTDDRIRKLYHSFLQGGGRTTRHRGKSPRQAAYFLRTAQMRDEASALASLCCLVGLFDGHGHSPCPRPATGVNGAASLLRAYEGYRAAIRNPAITLEHAALLVNALARGSELRLGDCQDCGALLVVDALGLRPTRCCLCSKQAASDPARPFTLVTWNSRNAGSR